MKRESLAALMVTFLFVLGCSDEIEGRSFRESPDGGESSSAEARADVGECGTLAEAECAADVRCTAVFGTGAQNDAETEFLGCRETQDCIENQADFALSPDSKCFELMEGGCLPLGWPGAGEAVFCQERFGMACAGMAERTCVEAEYCEPAYADRLRDLPDGTTRCDVGEFAGCRSIGTCSNQITYVEDSDGACWAFSSTCLPDKWGDTEYSNSCATRYLEEDCGSL